MNPVYFGQAPRSLFGVYHSPEATDARGTGVVLCYPFGQEYMRAHRAFRQMALLLSRAGFHVLRFDYYGTGDSAGEAAEVHFTEWVEDVGTAADELKAAAAITKVAFVGLRLGAAAAALAATGRDDVDHVILWDPVVRGADYLTEITGLPPDAADAARRTLERHVVGVLGFPVTQAMSADLRRLDIMQAGAPAGSGRLVIASHHREEYAALGRLPVPGTRVRYAVVPSEGNWNEVDDYGGALIPVLLIQSIIAHLVAEVR